MWIEVFELVQRLVVLFAGVAFLLPVMLVVWELATGHRRRDANRKFAAKYSLRAMFGVLTGSGVLLAIALDVRVGLVLATISFTCLAIVSCCSMLQDLRGPRATERLRIHLSSVSLDETLDDESTATEGRLRKEPNLSDWEQVEKEIDRSVGKDESATDGQSSRSPGAKKKWWAKRSPAMRFSRYGHWL